MIFHDVFEPPFVIGGALHPKDNCGELYRLDASKKEIYSAANAELAHCTSGVTVRFVTDADKITVRDRLSHVIDGMHHFTHRGVRGLDFLTGSGTDRRYCGAMMQTFAENTDTNEGELSLNCGETEVEMLLPLYSGVSSLEIGIPEGASLKAPPERSMKPIAFYGSSITQGGCASRPGTAFANIVCRFFDADCINLGFSGSAFGESSVAEYLAGREMSLFVMDYVFNSRSLEELQTTHYPFYRVFRDSHPDTPVLFCTHPRVWPDTEYDRQRTETVEATYLKAIAGGDRNVYLLHGEDYFPAEMRDLCMVDYLHPNDLGMYFMAKAMIGKIKAILANS